MKEIDSITTWKQGRFIDQKQYSNWSEKDKEQSDYLEKFNVRPSPLGNAICRCNSHEDAKWITERLNLAAKSVEGQ